MWIAKDMLLKAKDLINRAVTWKNTELVLVCVFLLGKLLGKFCHYPKGNTNVSVLMFMSAL